MNITMKGVDIKNVSKDMIISTTDFENLIKKYTAVIDNINTAWQGDDALAYVNNARDKYVTQMTSLVDLMKTYGEYLSKIPPVYEELDSEHASKSIDA